TILQGALRFISGQIAKDNPGGLQIATPVGTIGVRGTIAAVEAGNGATTIILLDPQNAPAGGALVIQTAAGEARLSQAGEGLVLRDGGAPPVVREFTEDEVNALLGRAGGGVWVKPRAAAPGGSTTTAAARITRADCEALMRDALRGPNFVPGVDVRGNRVAPADGGSILGGAAQPEFTINLTLDALEAAGVDTGFAGVEGATSLGDIRVRGGQAYLGGALLDPQGTDELRLRCREQMAR
ncbi:MAG: hypothetical protein AAF684_00885, partial [Pseudomonadota bacterium]